MARWRNGQRIRQYLRAAVRGRAQADDLRSERDGAVIFVVGNMAQGNVYGQGVLTFSSFKIHKAIMAQP